MKSFNETSTFQRNGSKLNQVKFPIFIPVNFQLGGKLMADLKQEREEETAVMWDIVNKLKKIVANPE